MFRLDHWKLFSGSRSLKHEVDIYCNEKFAKHPTASICRRSPVTGGQICTTTTTTMENGFKHRRKLRLFFRWRSWHCMVFMHHNKSLQYEQVVTLPSSRKPFFTQIYILLAFLHAYFSGLFLFLLRAYWWGMTPKKCQITKNNMPSKELFLVMFFWCRINCSTDEVRL